MEFKPPKIREGSIAWYMLQEARKRREEEKARRAAEEERRNAQLQEEEERRQKWLRRQRILSDSVGVFLEDKEGFCFDPQKTISTAQLYEIYCRWCQKQKVGPEGLRAISYRLKHNRGLYPVREATVTRDGRRVRGFRGIRATDVTDKEEITS